MVHTVCSLQSEVGEGVGGGLTWCTRVLSSALMVSQSRAHWGLQTGDETSFPAGLLNAACNTTPSHHATLAVHADSSLHLAMSLRSKKVGKPTGRHICMSIGVAKMLPRGHLTVRGMYSTESYIGSNICCRAYMSTHQQFLRLQ